MDNLHELVAVGLIANLQDMNPETGCHDSFNAQWSTSLLLLLLKGLRELTLVSPGQ